MDKLPDIVKYFFLAVADNPAIGVPLAAVFGAALVLPALALFTAVGERARRRAHPGQSRRARRSAAFWLGSLCAALALAFFVIGAVLTLDFASYYYALIRWPAAPGSVLSARADCPRDARSGCRAYVRYVYAYGEGEAELRSGRLFPGDRAAADALLAPYPKGAQVMVRYSPGNYRKTRLEGAGTVNVRTAALFLALSYIFAGILIFMGRRTTAALGRMMPLNMPPLERK